jgi:DnaD/phage-associated family protein
MLGGTLTSPEMSVLAYFYDTLHFSSELIEYLIEYCITNDHRSFRYIEKVALSWHEKGITTVREAKTANMNYNDTTYDVLDAFGIKDRSAGRVELDYINRWNEMFGNNTSIIVEACNRTMRATHKPSFEYADTILMRWKEANVKNPDDIKRIDESYEKSQADKKRCASNPNDKKGVAGKNKFNNFELQGNIDVDALEKAMLSKNDL